MSRSLWPEPLDDFLNRPPRLPADANVKEKLFQETLRMRPGARRWRAPLAMMAAAAAVAAVLVSYVLWRPQSRPVLPLEPQEKGGPVALAPKVKLDSHPKAPSPPTQVVSQPRDLEWRAFDTDNDQERARLYFEAGDLYLDAEQDIDAALRCYQQALRHCDARELQFDPRDNWLVMALKNDRRKEP